MNTLTHEIYNELRWFVGRQVGLMTILSTENDYEYYHEGRMQLELRKIKGFGEVVDILLAKDEGSKGATFESKQLREYMLDNREVEDHLVKTLTIYLKDGSMFSLTAKYVVDDQHTDITISDEYARFLFNLIG
ncbi:hypothetical protein BEP19_03140 [Ammoniphilus oxalaticus]|uniref:Uncharacterized protein n=1 Tax=Ammoniphilus oxalaticus TaxID=66863 RepID=A0A419SNR7_9BACL|nr:hypothetical protein [Ammoniphilus oxalaticus]RKD25936.1 hypothetical protein BEP19_03140 [Ammoniphilus oxalaticus]